MRLGVITAFAFWLLAASSAAGAPLPHNNPLYSPSGSPIVNENPEVSAVYKGTISMTADLPPHGDPASTHRAARMEWEMGVSGPVDQIEYTGVFGAQSIHWKLGKLTGTVEEKNTEPDGKPYGCSGTFSPTASDVGTIGVFVPHETPGHPAGGGNPATNSDYTVSPPGGLPVSLLQSSGPQGTGCQTSNWTGTGSSTWGNPVAFSPDPAVQSAFGDTVFPTVYFPPGGSRTHPLNFSFNCAPPSCGLGGLVGERIGSTSVKIESSITFSSPGLSSGKESSKKTSNPGSGGGSSTPGCSGPACKDKTALIDAARTDIRAQLPVLKLECAITAIGTSLLVAGVVAPETGVGSVLAAAGPVGAEILVGAGPACGLLIKRIFDDAKTIEDPPSASFRKLARPAVPRGPAAKLPVCSSFAAEVHAFCERLRAAELRYVGSIRGGQAVAAAMLTTANRISGAVRAHAGGPLRAQMANARALRSQMKANISAERAAGRALASLISGAQVSVKLSAAQVQAGIAKGFKGLSALHYSGARAERLAGITLSAAPADVLATLSQ